MPPTQASNIRESWDLWLTDIISERGKPPFAYFVIAMYPSADGQTWHAHQAAGAVNALASAELLKLMRSMVDDVERRVNHEKPSLN